MHNDTQDEHTDIVYAGFWIRFAAGLIDFVAYFIVYSICQFLIRLTLGFYVNPLIIGFAAILLLIWYWYKRGATPGKKHLKLKIVDARTFLPITLPQAIGRYLGYNLSMLGLCIGFFWIGYDKRKQGWHDKIAQTVVIQTGKLSMLR